MERREPLETAAEHLTRRVPVAAPWASAEETRRALTGRRFESAAVAVCEDQRLVGLVRTEDLLAAAGDTPLRELMDPDPPVVAPGADQEVVAWKAVQREQSTIAVVDREGRFLGLVPPRRLLFVLLWEHEEDMARMGGLLRGALTAWRAAREPLAWRLWHRLPWLVLGLAGALLFADLVGAFEAQLQASVILAFFLPGIVYLADAVGTQTETLVVRGLSVGVDIRQTVGRELLTGMGMGLGLALVLFPLVLLRWGAGDVALAVALSVLAASTVATLVAMLLPWGLHRLGRDPAFGSGPLATVIQAMRDHLPPAKAALLKDNEQALERGAALVEPAKTA